MIRINRMMPDGPAARGGLLVGDYLLMVNGVSLVNSTRSQALETIRTSVGLVTVVVWRAVPKVVESTLFALHLKVEDPKRHLPAPLIRFQKADISGELRVSETDQVG